MDMGRGRFPLTLDKHSEVKWDESAPGGYTINERSVAFDRMTPHGFSNNLLFEERNEDLNGNGVLDPGEDTDHDGRLDSPNLMVPDACDSNPFGTLERDRCLVDNLLTFYDREDNTLILRPVWPLEERCSHAVVLTKRLRQDGRAIQSPFPQINHADQTPVLKPLEELLPRYELEMKDVAFAWSFKTGSMTRELEALRAGLYGHGVFSRLASEFPVTALDLFVPVEGDAQGALLNGACAGLTLSKAWEELIGSGSPICAHWMGISAHSEACSTGRSKARTSW